jgi:hypothetical protein
MAQENQEVISLLTRKKDQGVLADITISPQGIPIGECPTTPVHPLSGSIIIGLGCMKCEEK